MGNDFTTAQALFAGTAGPVSMSFVLFASIFAAVNDPLQGAVNEIIGALAGWIHPVMLQAGILVCIATILTVIMSDGVSSNIATNTILPIVIRTGILIWLLGGVALFTQYISGPILALPNTISGVVLGATGNAAITNGGVPFDTLWNHTFMADVKAAKAVSFWTLEGLILGFVTLLSGVFAGLFIGFMFVKYLIAFVRLSLVVAVAPLFVASMVSRHTRNWFAGWLNAGMSAVLVLVLISVLLAILIKAQQQQIDLIMNAPANADIIGLVGSAIGVAILTFIGAVMTAEIPGIAVGIASGIYQEGERALTMIISGAAAAGSGMAGALGGMMGGGATAATAGAGSSAGMAPVGRSLSGASYPPSPPGP